MLINGERNYKPGNSNVNMAEFAPNAPKQPVGRPATRPEPSNEMTQREREVFDLLFQGKKRKEIALALGITPATVSQHLDHIKQKGAL